MTTENSIRDHQTWLGYLQPDGLVVSPAALVDAQVYLDRDVAARQREFQEYVNEVEVAERDVMALRNLHDFLCGFLGWPPDLLFGLPVGNPIPESLTIGLPELNETLVPTLAFADVSPNGGPPSWLLLVKELPLGTDLDLRETGRDFSWSASATQKLERLLRETGVLIGLLSNGTQLRLLYAPRGENSGSLTFPVQAMTEVAGRAILSAFLALLSRERLLSGPVEARLPALLVKSRDYQATVSKELAGQVLDALYELVRGLQVADAHTKGELLKRVLAEHPDEIYRGLLTVLLRLIFLLYAEDRELLPTSELYVENYSVHGLFTRLRSDAQRYQDTMDQRYGAWARLVALFRAVYGGSRHPMLRMPPRKGFLFDPDRFPFLEGRLAGGEPRIPLIADGVIYRVLDKLMMLGGERLSYRTLDVEQIGSVYETMMGFRLEQTVGRTIAVKAGKSGGAPIALDIDALLKLQASDRLKNLTEKTDFTLSRKASDALREATSVEALLSALERHISRSATPHVLPAGHMVLQPTDERRRSGSHYTPRPLTEPIVRTTLKPILERLGASPKPDQVLDLKVCDIAVGSGAFLVEVCRQLGDVLLRAWHAHAMTPTIPPDEDELLHARRVVAQRCLYGVDRNSIAVDLTKLSLWLATLAKDHPFTFLDHAIRTGDSLVGLTPTQLADFHWREERSRVFGQEFLEQRIAIATTQRQLILALEDDTAGSATKSEKLLAADGALNLVRQAGDLVVAAFFEGAVEKHQAMIRNDYLARFTEFCRTSDGEFDPASIASGLRNGEQPLSPFHWEIEFPEVFERTTHGFDAIVGNPPWISFSGREAQRGWPPYIEWLERAFVTFGGWRAIHPCFVERAVRLTHDRGSVGLLLPAAVADLDGYGSCRAFVRKHGSPQLPFVYFGENAFLGVVQPSFALLAARTPESHALSLLSTEPFALQRTRVGREEAPPSMSAARNDDLLHVARSVLGKLPRAPEGTFKDPGVHTGNCSQHLILLSPTSSQSMPIREGKTIQAYQLQEPSKWLALDYRPATGEYFRIGSRSVYWNVPIVLRQTASRPIAALHDPPAYFRNSVLACTGLEGVDARLVVCWLNSSIIGWFHLMSVREANQKAFPQVKIKHLKALPVPNWHEADDETLRALYGRRVGADSSSFAEWDLRIDLEIGKAMGIPEEVVLAIREAVAAIEAGAEA